MPRADRLVELVQFLGGRRAHPLREIVERFGVSERTVFRDLRDIERWAPLQRDEAGYRLLDTATIRPLKLTPAEYAILRLALDNPALRKNAAIRRRLQSLESKLEAATRAIDETPGALVLAGRERSGEIDSKIHEQLELAIARQHAVQMLYTSLSGHTEAWRGADPYRLFHRDGVWYAVGRCHVHDEPRIFRLDRICDLRLTKRHFTLGREFTLDEFLRRSWSVFRGDELHHIVLEFDASLAPLIRHGNHHPDEEVSVLRNGDLEYRVRLSYLDEIARWVVGFGGRCRVMEPEALQEKVVALATSVLETRKTLDKQQDTE